MKRLNLILLSIAALFTILSCNKKDWSKKTELSVLSSSNFDEGAVLGNNKLIVDSAKLFVSSIHIEGRRLQGDDLNEVLASNYEIDLLHPMTIEEVGVPIGTYDSLLISFELTSASYLAGQVEKVNGNPDIKQIYLPLDYDQKTLIIDVIAESGNEIVSFGEEGVSTKVMFDLQSTLTSVGNGAWNALIAASQSQTSVDVTTIAGENFLINFKEQLLENSSLKIE